MRRIKFNETRAKNAVLLIKIVLGIQIASLIFYFFQYNLLKDIASGIEITVESANANDLRILIIDLLLVIAHIISMVTFILWFRRAYYNIKQKSDYLLYSDGWAAGSWFVPVLNWFRPYQMMKELFEETRYVFEKQKEEVNYNLNMRLLGLWWGFWIVYQTLSSISQRTELKAETLDQFLRATEWSMLYHIIGIPTAILVLKVMKDYMKTEPILYQMDQEPVEEI